MSKPKIKNPNSLSQKLLRFLKANSIDEFLEDRLFEESDLKSLGQENQSLAIKEDINSRINLDVEKWTQKRGKKYISRFYYIISALICLLSLFAMLRALSQMPNSQDPSAPPYNEVARRYIEKGPEETGAQNIVAGMILDYRAFDTLGESTVLFAAACAVIVLLRADKDEKESYTNFEIDDRHFEPKNDKILQATARILSPIVMLLGIYIILNGHISPGGGFSGGAVLSSGLILYLNAFGFEKAKKIFSYNTFKYTSLFSLTFYLLAKTYVFFMGANGHHGFIPLGKMGAILSAGLILPLNIAVGLVVACTMYMSYALFRKGGL